MHGSSDETMDISVQTDDFDLAVVKLFLPCVQCLRFAFKRRPTVCRMLFSAPAIVIEMPKRNMLPICRMERR
jgi:hypothetical protein